MLLCLWKFPGTLLIMVPVNLWITFSFKFLIGFQFAVFISPCSVHCILALGIETPWNNFGQKNLLIYRWYNCNVQLYHLMETIIIVFICLNLHFSLVKQLILGLKCLLLREKRSANCKCFLLASIYWNIIKSSLPPLNLSISEWTNILKNPAAIYFNDTFNFKMRSNLLSSI